MASNVITDSSINICRDTKGINACKSRGNGTCGDRFRILNERLSRVRELQRLERYAEAMEIITSLSDEALTEGTFDRLIEDRMKESDSCTYEQYSGLGEVVKKGCERIEKAHLGGSVRYELRDEILDTVVMWLCNKDLLNARGDNLVSYLINRISFIGDACDITVRNTYGLHRVPEKDQALYAAPGARIHRMVFASDRGFVSGTADGEVDCTGLASCRYLFAFNRSVEEEVFGEDQEVYEEGSIFAGVINECVMQYADRLGLNKRDIIAYARVYCRGAASTKAYGDAGRFCRYLSFAFYQNKLRDNIDTGLEERGISENSRRSFRRNTMSWTGQHGFKRVICAALYIANEGLYE